MENCKSSSRSSCSSSSSTNASSSSIPSSNKSKRRRTRRFTVLSEKLTIKPLIYAKMYKIRGFKNAYFMKIENKIRIQNDYKSYLKKTNPNFPEYAYPIKVFSDSDTKKLTKCILYFLQFNGHHASEQHTTGTMIDKRQIVTDVLGRQRQIGSIQWGASRDEVGRADIIAKIMVPFKGRLIPISVEIEIKFGRDSQSEKQKEFQTKLENIGAIYTIVKNFDDFLIWYDDFIKSYS